MKNGLAAKVTVAAVIPLVAFLFAAIQIVRTQTKYEANADLIETNMNFVVAISRMVNELQLERALSVAYLSSALSREELEAQRAQSDDKRTPFKQAFSEVVADKSVMENAMSALNFHFDMTRKQVSAKEIAAFELIDRMNGLMGSLIAVDRSLADQSQIEGLGERIRSLNILEVAKENAAKLRANMTAIVSTRASMSEDQISLLTSLKAEMNANLKSPGLVISAETKDRIDGFAALPHWVRADEIVRIFIKRAIIRSASLPMGNASSADPKEILVQMSGITADIDSVITSESRVVNRIVAIAQNAAKRTVWLITFIVLSVSLGLMAFLFFIVRAITKPIINVMNNLKGAGEHVSKASEQLSGVSQHLSSGAAEAAASLQETVSSLEALSSKVRLNTDHAQQASSLSQVSRTAAEQGEVEIRRLITAMGDISQSSKKVEEIINVIDDIAFQTNLLALNAAVEAARAGEQGKGFAVVADAVRNLAQRSAGAAKEISGLIKETVAHIGHGSQIADSSGAVLKNIVVEVKKVADLNNEIALASEDQATGISQLSRSMALLDKSTQSNAAVAEESSASSTEMSAQAAALGLLVGDLSDIVNGERKIETTIPVPVVSNSIEESVVSYQPPKGTGLKSRASRAPEVPKVRNSVAPVSAPTPDPTPVSAPVPRPIPTPAPVEVSTLVSIPLPVEAPALVSPPTQAPKPLPSNVIQIDTIKSRPSPLKRLDPEKVIPFSSTSTTQKVGSTDGF
ncbi:MAG: methyl-accepting chemotaxis protein [Bdellovibrionota bacterium]